MIRILLQIVTMIAVLSFLGAAAFGQSEWTRQSPRPAARDLTGVAWATSTHGFASGVYGTFIETFDGGTTWRNVDLDIFPSDPFYNVLRNDVCYSRRSPAGFASENSVLAGEMSFPFANLP